MNSEIIKKVIAEWLGDKDFPPLVKRDAPDLVLERTPEIIARGRSETGRENLLYVSTDPGSSGAGKLEPGRYQPTASPMTSGPC